MSRFDTINNLIDLLDKEVIELEKEAILAQTFDTTGISYGISNPMVVARKYIGPTK